MGGPDETSVFQSAFASPEDEYNPNLGVRPFVFDILGPDMETSVLPVNLRMVLHAPPQSVNISYTKQIERIQTRGGFVEQHWGEGARTIDFSMVTGGFMRLFSGLSNVTGGPGSEDTGGSRRETISYDKYLDLLALFHNNGSVYDATGKIVFQGVIQVTFDGGIYNGWWGDFKVSEDSSRPYLFSLTANFLIDKEIQRFRTPLPAGDGLGSF